MKKEIKKTMYNDRQPDPQIYRAKLILCKGNGLKGYNGLPPFMYFIYFENFK